MITVYQLGTSVRVVVGAHKAHDGSSKYRVAVYGNESTDVATAAALALANESDEAVCAAIMRLVPVEQTAAVTDAAGAIDTRSAARNALALLKQFTAPQGMGDTPTFDSAGFMAEMAARAALVGRTLTTAERRSLEQMGRVYCQQYNVAHAWGAV